MSSADARIEVECRREYGGWACTATVIEGATTTRHEVTVSDEELEHYARASCDVTALVERSLRFLLAREPKESILRNFALGDIERYFPEYGAWITR